MLHSATRPKLQEAATRQLLVSLPLTSILAMVGLLGDTGDSEHVAALPHGTFWLLLPTLPMPLILPYLMRHGVDFWMALACPVC